MAGMLRETTAADGLQLQIEHAFLEEDAVRIHELIEGAAPGTAIDIDFRRMRDCHAVAIALLARDLAGGRARVALHGTSRYVERLLEYLGVRAAAERRAS
jgi:hypothetical protein